MQDTVEDAQSCLEHYFKTEDFWYEKQETSYTLNCVEVWKKAKSDANTFKLNVEDSGRLIASYRLSNGLRQKCEFKTVPEFKIFYGKLVSEGVDAV